MPALTRCGVTRGAARAAPRPLFWHPPPAPPRTPRSAPWPMRLDARADEVVAANAGDVERAVAAGTAAGLVDRLTLTRNAWPRSPRRCAKWLSCRIRSVRCIRGYTLPNGLEVRQIRVPLGVVGIIYEARPNVTVDAAGLGLKSGNAVLLRGSSSAYDSNTALVGVMQDALEASGLAARLHPTGAGYHARIGQALDDRTRAGRRSDPTRWSRTDPIGRRGVDGSRHRDRGRQLSRLHRCGRRHRQGSADPGQRQDPAPQRLQRGRDVPGARRHSPRVPAPRVGSAQQGRGHHSWRCAGWPRSRAQRVSLRRGYRRRLGRRVLLPRHRRRGGRLAR